MNRDSHDQRINIINKVNFKVQWEIIILSFLCVDLLSLHAIQYSDLIIYINEKVTVHSILKNKVSQWILDNRLKWINDFFKNIIFILNLIIMLLNINLDAMQLETKIFWIMINFQQNQNHFTFNFKESEEALLHDSFVSKIFFFVKLIIMI